MSPLVMKSDVAFTLQNIPCKVTAYIGGLKAKRLMILIEHKYILNNDKYIIEKR